MTTWVRSEALRAASMLPQTYRGKDPARPDQFAMQRPWGSASSGTYDEQVDGVADDLLALQQRLVHMVELAMDIAGDGDQHWS